MKLFTKLALVSAIAVSGQTMAMESMDDSALSSSTGQEGITLTIKPGSITKNGSTFDGISIDKLLIHDEDGLVVTTAPVPPATTPTVTPGKSAGAIVVKGITVKVDSANATNATFNAAYGADALAGVRIDTDGGTNVDGSEAVLNIGLALNATEIGVDGIYVGKSNTGAMTGARRGTVGTDTQILGALNVNVGVSKLNIQLGNTSQGAMIVANGTINNGITISGIDLKDNSQGTASGSIGIDSLKITSANSADLNVNTSISVRDNGAGDTGLLISPTGSNDIYMSAVRLGNAGAASIGAVEIQGMNMGTGASIMVSGH